MSTTFDIVNIMYVVLISHAPSYKIFQNCAVLAVDFTP